MSSRIWTPRAVASESTSLRLDVWRAVEAQHVVSTMALVDTLDEQHVLERLWKKVNRPFPRAQAICTICSSHRFAIRRRREDRDFAERTILVCFMAPMKCGRRVRSSVTGVGAICWTSRR